MIDSHLMMLYSWVIRPPARRIASLTVSMADWGALSSQEMMADLTSSTARTLGRTARAVTNVEKNFMMICAG